MLAKSSAFVLFALAITAPILAIDAEQNDVSEDIRALIQDRDYAAAIEAIDQALANEDSPADYLLYLKGRACHYQKKYDEAALTFDKLVDEHAESDWVRQAKFAKAAALARKGGFRAAEVIYKEQAEYLLSTNRKQEIATIYLDFAEAYFRPEEAAQQPNYEQARKFFEKALEIGPEPKLTAEIKLRVGQCWQEQENFTEAADRYRSFVEEYRVTQLDIPVMLAEARFRLGWSELQLGQLAEARRTWQDLLADEELAKRLDGTETLGRLAEARFHLAKTYGAPQPSTSEDLDLSIAALEAFIEHHPTHELASKAHLQIAQSFVHRGRFAEAASRLNQFLAETKYAMRDETPDARFLLGQCLLQQERYNDAIAAWRDYLGNHPAHHQWTTAQQQIIQAEYLAAEKEFDDSNYDKARELWQEFLAKYPLDGRAPRTLYLFGQIEFNQENWQSAIDTWRNVVSKYPDTNESSQAQYFIAVTLETKLHQLEDALQEYKKVTWGNYEKRAKQRIGQLTAKQLSIATKRVFRTEETPQIELSSRNIENVTVKVFAVDLETYFRKMHLAQGVEDLDIALIDPDKTFEFKVPDYQKLKHTSVPVEIEWDKDAAALAVTVSSKTLEATTMVLRSDLDVIVKCSRDEVFVFAQNMRTGKPWPDARLLVSDGGKVFAEVTTGKDGVLQASYEELKQAGDVRVFATAEGNYASSVINLGGLGASEGLADKGYIYTDRPAYRAGQMVHVRGVIRRVAGDKYAIEENKPFEVRVFDPRGRQIWDRDVALSRFGSFHAHFLLPSESPQGPYRIDVRETEKDGKARAYQGGFLVHEYKLEPVRLVVDTDRQVFYRGEKIKGKIRAEFYYGAPLANREIRYQLAGGDWTNATTDEEGEIEFNFDTREFRETMSLPLVVMLPERNIGTQSVFILATRGFSIGMHTSREVYLAKESFETAITTTDAMGEPVAKDIDVQLVKRTEVNGKPGEKVVETKPVATSKDDGIGRAVFTADDGGSYIIRVSGMDRFDNAITAEHAVQISDDDDTIRLRILADKYTFKVGDEARIRVHWREEPALALVTHQGSRVLGYQLVELRKGDNEILVKMAADLAPNFDLQIAVMTDPRESQGHDGNPARRFHEASAPVAVIREMNVQLAIAGAEGALRPGQEADVDVTATDPQGRPLSAELSLAMIEQSLLDRFPSQLADIDDYFRGSARVSAVRTASSVTFAYNPNTREIDRALLAERERLEIEEEELRRLSELGDALIDRGTDDRFSSAFSDSSDARSHGAVPMDSQERSEAEPAIMGGLPAARGAAGGGYGEYAGKGAADQAAKQEESVSLLGGSSRLSTNVTDVKDLVIAEDFREADGNGIALPQEEKALVDFFSKSFVAEAQSTAGATDWTRLSNEAVVMQNGRWGYLNLADMDEAKANAWAEQFAGTATRMLSPLHSPETGYWNPAVATDTAGKATVTITLPDRSTAWAITARGITAESLAGESTMKLSAQKDLFGELRLPLAFVDGDRAKIRVTVHNDAVEDGEITVKLTTRIGKWEQEATKTITVDGKGLQELLFEQTIDRQSARHSNEAEGSIDVNAAFELTVIAGDKKDTSRRLVSVLPYGLNVVNTASGTADSDASARVELPANMPIEEPGMQISIAPNTTQSLLEVVLGPQPIICRPAIIGSDIESTASDLMAALALMDLLQGTDKSDGPEAATLDERIRTSIGALVSAQQDSGSWTWTGGTRHNTQPDRYVSARIVWALSMARRAGYQVPDDSFNKGVNFIRGVLADIANDDYETRAVLVHALAAAGHGDFAQANRLYRQRQTLSAAGLAYAALAFTEMNRKEIAGQLLEVFDQRNLVGETATTQGKPRLSWNTAAAEVHALYALALQGASPADPKAAAQAEWLLAHRTGHRWAPDKATGPATMAAAQWLARNHYDADTYELTVFINDNQVAELAIGPDTNTQTIDVPSEALTFAGGKSRQDIRFQLEGRGRYSYQVALGGFVPADKVKATANGYRVHRRYEPAPIEVDGQTIPRGFDIVEGSYSSFHNPLTQLAVGKRGIVTLQVWRDNVDSRTPEHELPYLAVTEPIPAGASVVEGSLQGAFERYEIGAGQITFYVGTRRYIGDISYEIHGYLPGNYRVAPTTIRDAYDPGQWSVAGARTLEVLPLGEKSSDDYRLTPQELYELGQRDFHRGNMQAAAQRLGKLLADWNLRAETYKQTVQMLLDAYLDIGPAHKVVQYFEIVKEKWPELEISFDKILQIGSAYDDMGEYERSYMVFRATVESRFMTEARVAGFLQNEGEFLKSVDVMSRILTEYPPEPYVATARYALAQQVYMKAATAADDSKLREKKITRVDLVRQAASMLNGFLTLYPEDPAADQASFSLASGLLELEQYQSVIAVCEKYMQRYPKSKLRDSFLYTIGFCHFALGHHEEALETCGTVAEMERTSETTGQAEQSEDRWRAIYILGQIYHSLGRAAEAIDEYSRVKDRFPDAAQAIEYFSRRSIRLPEVTTLRPDEEKQVQLSFRNVASADLRVYRIELMKFSLLKRNLENITSINLAGIRPYHEARIELGDGKDYRDRERRIELPLNEEGAYLVVCRGDDLHTSGLMLVSPLELHVQEDIASGRVRATVKNAVEDAFVADVHVKVIGTGNESFHSGGTDLRGVYLADNIQGTTTVIAQNGDDRYAFFRGKTYLGPDRDIRSDRKNQVRQQLIAPAQDASNEMLLEGVMGTNSGIQLQGQQMLEHFYNNSMEGVQVEKAK